MISYVIGSTTVVYPVIYMNMSALISIIILSSIIVLSGTIDALKSIAHVISN